MSRLNKVLTAIFALLFLSIPIGAAQARLSIKESTKYYKIKAKNAKGVRKQIARKGLMRRGRNHAIATTKINLKVDRVKVQTRGRRCSIRSARIRLKLVYTLPRWTNAKRASKKARRKWNTYYKQIVRHEKKHGAIAKSMARNLDRSIRKLKGRTSRRCRDLTRKAKRLYKSVNKKYDRQQRVFDKREHRKSSHIMKLARAFAFSN